MRGIWFSELNVDQNDFVWKEGASKITCNLCQVDISGGRKSSLQSHINSLKHVQNTKRNKEEEQEDDEDPLREILETRIKQAAKKRILSEEYMDEFMNSPLGKELVKERMLKKLKEKGY